MSVVYFNITGRVSGVPTPGLTPVWSVLFSSATRLPVPAGGQPPIVEVGGGIYQIAYDTASQYGEITGILDFGAQIPSGSERFADIYLTADSNLISMTARGLGLSGATKQTDGLNHAYDAQGRLA